MLGKMAFLFSFYVNYTWIWPIYQEWRALRAAIATTTVPRCPQEQCFSRYFRNSCIKSHWQFRGWWGFCLWTTWRSWWRPWCLKALLITCKINHKKKQRIFSAQFCAQENNLTLKESYITITPVPTSFNSSSSSKTSSTSTTWLINGFAYFQVLFYYIPVFCKVLADS